MAKGRKSPFIYSSDVISILLKFYGTIDECNKWKLSVRNNIKDMTKGQHKWFMTTPVSRYIYDKGRVDNIEWTATVQFDNKEIATLFKLSYGF